VSEGPRTPEVFLAELKAQFEAEALEDAPPPERPDRAPTWTQLWVAQTVASLYRDEVYFFPYPQDLDGAGWFYRYSDTKRWYRSSDSRMRLLVAHYLTGQWEHHRERLLKYGMTGLLRGLCSQSSIDSIVRLLEVELVRHKRPSNV
jgi:hypothetical protein